MEDHSLDGSLELTRARCSPGNPVYSWRSGGILVLAPVLGVSWEVTQMLLNLCTKEEPRAGGGHPPTLGLLGAVCLVVVVGARS